MKKPDHTGGYYGWTAERIQAHTKMFGLGTGDHLLVKRLQEAVIAPNAVRIVGEFYRFLGNRAEFKQIIAQGYNVHRLKATQTSYLRTLGVDFDGRDYFEERTRIGAAHARAQVPLPLYQAAYSLLQRLILASFPETLRSNPQEHAKLAELVLKLTALDMSLAVETYHRSEVAFLEKSLSSLRAETGELQRQIDRDPLTGLINKGTVAAMIDAALSNSQHDASPMCLIMADLDHFKDINDRHGHLIGDSVLRDIAGRLRAAARASDSVGRYGGEEFIILMPHTRLDSAKRVAERIRRHIMQTPVKVNRVEIPITISLGLTQAVHNDDNRSLIGRADAALYDAKNAGRNRVEVRLPPVRNGTAHDRGRLETVK